MNRITIPVQHASYSSMTLYNDCSKMWYFQYVCKLPRKPILAMQIGSTNHTILENINTWIKVKKTVPDTQYFFVQIDDIVKTSLPLTAFVDTKPSSKAEEKLSKEEFCAKQQTQITAQLKTMCALYITIATKEFKEVLFVEKDHLVDIENIPYKMVADAIVICNTDELKILDYKTKAKTSDDIAILQLTGYNFGMRDLVGRPIDGLEQWDFIKKTQPEIIVHRLDISTLPEYTEVLKQEVKSFWTGIHNERFGRNLRSMNCGPERCPYWNKCMAPIEASKETISTAEFHKDLVEGLEHRRS